MDNLILEGFSQAIELIVTLDPEVIEITLLSLTVSLSATLLASAFCIPIGTLIYFNEFRGKRALINAIQTLYAMPTVLAGLLLLLFISNAGPFGFLRLLFTSAGMVVAQMILIIPLIIGLTISAMSGIGSEMRQNITSLGATKYQTILILIREARFAILAAVILGFGRAISEVGAAMIIGGNIRHSTRVLTTAIALESTKGEWGLCIALGIILLGVAVIVNLALNLAQYGSFFWGESHSS
jgi:tungstate transport system permease protein